VEDDKVVPTEDVLGSEDGRRCVVESDEEEELPSHRTVVGSVGGGGCCLFRRWGGMYFLFVFPVLLFPVLMMSDE
jgi:hypothetical protein